MSRMVRIEVPGFVIEAASVPEGAAKIARHFGTIADGIVQDSGLPIAHIATVIEED